MSSLVSWAHLPPTELALGAILVLVAWILGRRLPWRSRRTGGFSSDETASAMLDFVLVFPLFAMIVLTLVQLALLIHARMIVSYAAFTAARSAIVWLEEGPDEARERAERAAQIGCLAISPGDVASSGGGGAVSPLYLHSENLERFPHRALRGGSKMGWAQGATRVRVLPSVSPLGPHDPVTVEVTHDFYLSVPYGDRLFRDGTVAGLPTRTIEDSFTLTNEGRVQSR